MTTYQTSAAKHGISSEGNKVASNAYSRPADETFDTIDDLINFKKADASLMTSRVIDTHKIDIVGTIDEDNPSMGDVFVQYDCPKTGDVIEASPTNWSFGQLSQLAGAPAGYLKDLPAPLAADNLMWGLKHNRGRETIKTYGNSQSYGGELRAATGADYGRIYDHEILAPVKILCDEYGYKTPGSITGFGGGMSTYDPEAITSSTIWGSDRDLFVFQVDDRNPISIGKLPDGSDDLMFRGFYVWNSEVGSKTAGLAAFYLRGVCMNRNLWGVENFQEIKVRHSKYAPDRFANEIRPALRSFATGGTGNLLAGVQAAQSAKIARDDDDRLDFLTKRAGLSGRMAKAAMARHIVEEGKPVSSVWDAAQAITAIARDIPHQDQRVMIERKAGALLDKVAA